MAYLTERIGKRVLEMCDGNFVNNPKFAFSKRCEIENINTKEECISIVYTIRYGIDKEFEMIMSTYPNYKNSIQKPIVYSDDERLSLKKIDSDIARLHKFLA